MAPTEVRVTITCAKHLKNVNWRSGALRPYAVAWLDPASKCSTRVAADIDSDDGGVDAAWDGEALAIPLPPYLPAADAVLYLDVVHAAAPGDDAPKPLVGSARLPLRDLLDDPDAAVPRSLKLKRPSGRPQGKIEVEVAVRDSRHYAPPPPRAVDYGYHYSTPPQYAAGAPPQYAGGAPPQYAGGAPPQYAGAAPPQYAGGAPPQYAAGGPAYGAQGYPYGYGEGERKKESKFGLGTGLAVGAAAGLVGGLALAEGVDYVEDKIAEDVAEKVEEDLGYDDVGGGDDW